MFGKWAWEIENYELEARHKQHFIQRRNSLARKVIALDLEQSPKSPRGREKKY
jgi:hypothetical protein